MSGPPETPNSGPHQDQNALISELKLPNLSPEAGVEATAIYRGFKSTDPKQIEAAIAVLEKSISATEIKEVAEIRRAALSAIVTLLPTPDAVHSDKIQLVIRIVKGFGFTDAERKSPDVLNALENGYLAQVARGNLEQVILNPSPMPRGHEPSPQKLQAAAVQAYLAFFRDGNEEQVYALARFFQLSTVDLKALAANEQILEQRKKALFGSLREGNYQKVTGILSDSQTSEEILNSKEAKEAAQHGTLKLVLREDALISRWREEITIPLREVDPGSEIEQNILNNQLKFLQRGQVERVLELAKAFDLQPNGYERPILQEARIACAANLAALGQSDNALQILNQFPSLNDAQRNSPIHSEIISKIAPGILATANSAEITTFCERFNLRQSDFKTPEHEQAIARGLIWRIERANLHEISSFKDSYCSSATISTDKRFEAPLLARLGQIIAKSEIESSEWIERFKISTSQVAQSVHFAFVNALKQGPADAARVMARYELEAIPVQNLQVLPVALRSLSANFELTSIRDLVEFSTRDRRLVDFAFDHQNENMLLRKSDLPALSSLHLPNPATGERLKRGGVDLIHYAESKNFTELYSKLCDVDPQLVGATPRTRENFERAASHFGYEETFRFLGRDDAPRAEVLRRIDDLFRLERFSELAPRRFVGQILDQVKRDTSTNDERNSYDRLLDIALRMKASVPEVVVGARSLVANSNADELLREFSTPHAAFSSWNNLKTFEKILRIVAEPQVFRLLQTLENDPSPTFKAFTKALLYHPHSKVRLDTLRSFIERPATFLGGNDHEMYGVGPNYYFKVPGLDLSAKQVRDALPYGALDKIQVFKPLEINYEVAYMGDKVYVSLRDLLRDALGSRRSGIKGEAKDPGKLFGVISGLLKAESLNVLQYLEGQEISPELEKKVRAAALDPMIGLQANRLQLTAKVNLKSDPVGILAGDDTICCMPFGSAKANDYAWGPNSALFTVQLHPKESTARIRTIAQSVLTKDVVLTPAAAGTTELAQLSDKRVIGADNVEVNSNYASGIHAKAIEAIYADFFARYVDRYGDDMKVQKDLVAVGMSNSDALRSLEIIPNVFLPQAELGYSDKRYRVGKLALQRDTSALSAQLGTELKVDYHVESQPAPQQTRHLNTEDCLSVMRLRGPSDQLAIQNTIVAKDIYNVVHGAPNLSVKFVDESLRGYLIAYESGVDRTSVEKNSGSIIVNDAWVEPGSNLGAGKLAAAFADLYTKGYAVGDILPKIVIGFPGTPLQVNHQSISGILERALISAGKDVGLSFSLSHLEGQSVIQVERTSK